jgi:hypothetical protein
MLLASAEPPRLRNITHTRKISFSGLVIQITIASARTSAASAGASALQTVLALAK